MEKTKVPDVCWNCKKNEPIEIINYKELSKLILNNGGAMEKIKEDVSNGYSVARSLKKSRNWASSDFTRAVMQEIDVEKLANLIESHISEYQDVNRNKSIQKSQANYFHYERRKRLKEK